MSTVTLSENFDVKLPEDIRQALYLAPGDRLAITTSGGRVELVPVRPIREYRGFLRDMDATIDRDEEDRL